MPTKRRRHTITEVGGVEAALERLRAEFGEPDLRERLISRSIAAGVDLDASIEVRARGFSRDLDA